MALTETGFKRRTFDDITKDKIAKAKEMFGEDIETSEVSNYGKHIRINAYDQAIAEEEIEQLYWSIFPNTAFGTTLDHLCKNFVGITRNAATKSRYVVTLTGTAGAIIPTGFLVGTESGINFSLIGAAITSGKVTVEIVEGDINIGDNGTVEAVAECVGSRDSEEWDGSGELGNVLAKEITVIVNPSADIESVVGKTLIAKGTETESDYELRKRFDEAKAGLGSCNAVSLKSALLRVPTVTHAGVIINETDETDAGGRPPRSFECFVNGGDNYHKEIAEAIFDKKPIGIKTHGTVSQEILDNGGFPHTIKFSHTTVAPVYVRLAIKTSTEFEGDTGKKQIKSNLEAYIDNVGIGNSVILSSLYGQIHSVTGVQEVTTLEMSTDGSSWSTQNITVDAYENCVCMQVQIKQNAESDYEVIS